MRLHYALLSAALTVGFSGIAVAQDQPATTTTPQPPPAVVVVDHDKDHHDSDNFSATQSRWLLSGFVGSNFGARASDASVNFGGELGYLWHSVIGLSALANFTPDFKTNNLGFADDPHVNGYMLNAMLAAPIGGEAQFQPYLSGGVGEIELRSQVLNTPAVPASGFVSANQSRFGGTIGAGVMGFAGNVGVRGDIRYFRASKSSDFSTTPDNPAESFAQGVLSGLDFWRANIGLAFRW